MKQTKSSKVIVGREREGERGLEIEREKLRDRGCVSE